MFEVGDVYTKGETAVRILEVCPEYGSVKILINDGTIWTLTQRTCRNNLTKNGYLLLKPKFVKVTSRSFR